MANQHYTSLSNSTSTFADMLDHFGIVTVMDAYVFDYDSSKINGQNAYEIYQALKGTDKSNPFSTRLCKLDTLKVANVTVEGPTKSITGGKYANTLLKYGKTATMEIQDALGNAKAIEALCGGLVESCGSSKDEATKIGLHIGSDFSSAKTIIGDTFFIDQKTGQQVKVGIIFYQFLPDSLFNLTQDAEGDATVFDMNGSLLLTDIMVGNDAGSQVTHGVFYSIINPDHADNTTTN